MSISPRGSADSLTSRDPLDIHRLRGDGLDREIELNFDRVRNP